ncbi:hypothetical protein PM082_001928 [Marasmius tenuissimus]|nr:hypothetical protein PM082_015551 [Marasmius tenuissimus]KAJ8077497.1 hypothetical protein PM082_001928 [Marasmius tenuissimus]
MHGHQTEKPSKITNATFDLTCTSNVENGRPETILGLETSRALDKPLQNDSSSEMSPLDQAIVASCLRDGVRRVERLCPGMTHSPSHFAESQGDISHLEEPYSFAIEAPAQFKLYTPYYSWPSEDEYRRTSGREADLHLPEAACTHTDVGFIAV